MKIDKIKTLFIHIPKTGGVSIEQFFIYALLMKTFFEDQDFEEYVDFWPDIAKAQKISQLSKYGFGRYHFTKFYDEENRYSPTLRERYRLEHSSIVEHLDRKDDIMGHFKFSFVRNPWDRIVSLYTFIPSTSHYAIDPYKEIQKKGFKEFIKYVKENNLANSKESKYVMLRKQLDFISDRAGKIMVDFVGKFENFQADFDKVCEKIGIPTGTLPHKNKSNHKKYTEYYDDETKKLVEAIYKDDIAAFGYTFEN